MEVLILSLLLGVLIILADIFLAGIFFPLGFGVIVYGVVYFYTANFILSVAAFILTSIILYFFTFKLVKSKVSGGEINIKDILGLSNGVGVVIKETKDGFYIVRINGEDWLAESDEKLKKGDKIRITYTGVMLKVKSL